MFARTRKLSLHSEAARLSLALPERGGAAVVLKNGQSVSLYVRSVNSDGTARVQVAGADITARSEMPQGFSLQAGQVLKGNVFFEDGKVYIRLAQPAVTNSFSFSQLLASSGIAPSEATFRALQLFYASGMRMEPSLIRQALSLAAAFPSNEPRAAEAAALLLQKGLPLTEENLKAAIDMLEGRVFAENSSRAEEGILPFNPNAKDTDGSSEGRENESGRGENQKGKAENPDFFSAFAGGGAGEGAKAGPTWFILPFKRRFGESECAGSIRFLVGGAGGKALETRITAVSSILDEAGGFSADFVLSEGGCHFALSPQPQGRQAAKLADELSKILKKAGLAAATEYGFSNAVTGLESVDIEI